jgi:hypothetical protein
MRLDSPAINKDKLKNLEFYSEKWGICTIDYIDWSKYVELYPQTHVISNNFLNINDIRPRSDKKVKGTIYAGNIEDLQPKFNPFVMKSDIIGIEAAKLIPPEPVGESESKPKPKSNVKPPLTGLSCIADICGVGNVKVF